MRQGLRRQKHSFHSSPKSRWVYVGGPVLALAGGLCSLSYAVDEEKKEEVASEGFFEGIMNWWQGARKTMFNLKDENVSLLPDPIPENYGGKRYTVVISDDVLLTNVYEPTSGGLVTRKRPAAEFFLASLAKHYEVVLFSCQSFNERFHAFEKLDPNGHAEHRLFLDSTTMENGHSVKNLAQLNRNIGRVVAIDTDKHRTKQPENTIVLSKFDGSASDHTLLEVLAFFEVMAGHYKPDDVRPHISKLEKEPDFYQKQLETLRNRRRR